jgi:intracellular multiplication protein IcmE
MTNNYEDKDPNEAMATDDFIEPEAGMPASEDAPKTMSQNLVEAWRTKPMFKFLVLLVAVFAVGVAAFSFLGGGLPDTEVAHLSAPPKMKEAPGGKSSPYVNEQTRLANEERTQSALSSGGSAMPTPIGQNADLGGLGINDKNGDPLNELRAETERLKQQMQAQQMMIQQNRQPENFDNSLAEAMQRQMQQLLDSWTPRGIKQVAVAKVEDLNKASSASGSAAGVQNASSSSSSAASNAKIIVPAGTVSYAQLLTEANSDVPGPIMVQIVSGPLSGARAIGAFEVSDGYEKYLVLKFTLADKKGKDYAINAIALDPNTTLGGMATEVDERYFTRIVLPAAAGFLSGLGSAMGEGNTTTVSDGNVSITTTAGRGFREGVYNGLGAAADTMSQFFQNQANLTKPLVRVAAGTPMGLFFVSPVTDTALTAQAIDQQRAVQQTQGFTTNTGYSGTTVGGYGNSSLPYPNYAGTNNQQQRNTYGTTYYNGLGYSR